jgi:hypothetical protein
MARSHVVFRFTRQGGRERSYFDARRFADIRAAHSVADAATHATCRNSFLARRNGNRAHARTLRAPTPNAADSGSHDADTESAFPRPPGHAGGRSGRDCGASSNGDPGGHRQGRCRLAGSIRRSDACAIPSRWHGDTFSVAHGIAIAQALGHDDADPATSHYYAGPAGVQQRRSAA